MIWNYKDENSINNIYLKKKSLDSNNSLSKVNKKILLSLILDGIRDHLNFHL